MYIQLHKHINRQDFVERVAALYVLWKAERLVWRRVWVHQILHRRTQLGEFHQLLQGPVSERRLSENSEYVNPEMRETGFSVSKWEVCQTQENGVSQARF